MARVNRENALYERDGELGDQLSCVIFDKLEIVSLRRLLLQVLDLASLVDKEHLHKQDTGWRDHRSQLLGGLLESCHRLCTAAEGRLIKGVDVMLGSLESLGSVDSNSNKTKSGTDRRTSSKHRTARSNK